METLTANLTGRAKRVTRNGRDYLVAPARAIVEGVLAGSQGPLFYPFEEIARNPDDWNDMPAVVYHPVKNGRNVSGRSPDVLDAAKVGRIYDSVANDKARSLDFNVWFEVGATRRVDNRVYHALLNGEPLELSTGLFTHNEPAKEGAHHNGRPYDAIARWYRPDHVAILPDQTGACSIKDGCGVLVNSEGSLALNTDTTMTKEQAVTYLTANCDCWKGPGDKAVLESLDEPKLNALVRQAQAVPVANAAVRGVEAGDTLVRYDPESGSWKQGKKKPAAPPAVNTPPPPPPPEPSRRGKPADAEAWLADAPEEIRESFRAARAVEQREKEALVARLLANVAEGLRGPQRDRLLRRSVGELQADVALLPAEPRPEDVQRLPGSRAENRRGDDDMLVEPDWDWSGDGQAERAAAPAANAEPDGPGGPSEEEWLAAAPPRLRGRVQAAIAIEAQERRKLIDALTANLDDEQQQQLARALADEPLEKLRALTLLSPRREPPRVNYFGAAGGAPSLNGAGGAQDDVLVQPEWDWAEIARQN